MIASMTGYGRAERAGAQRTVTIEIRSVNHRYYDCSVRAPRLFTYLEEAVRARVQKAVTRGKVDVYIMLDFGGAETPDIALNAPVLEGYLSALHGMADRYGLREDLSVMALARLPEVFSVRRAEVDAEALLVEVTAAADEALAMFLEMRAREGARLAEDMLSRLDVVEALIAEIEARAPRTVAEYHTRLEARMQEVLHGVGVDENRILAEAALYADRVAVNEETVRLHSHIAQARALLRGGGGVGRKLDFLIQEFNREANTIGSKGNDAEIARLVVDMKSEIEKIREQAQNIE
ncbi:MAG: YicC family protein [Oscillospiraceae bacterium]|jgi:uncharacterized protein (TIGR00255 family)|nr:YicC family protein [Oscillospiraceae bacterium]